MKYEVPKLSNTGLLEILPDGWFLNRFGFYFNSGDNTWSNCQKEHGQDFLITGDDNHLTFKSYQL